MSNVYEVIVTREKAVTYSIAADNYDQAWDKFGEWAIQNGDKIRTDLDAASEAHIDYSPLCPSHKDPEDADIK